MTTPKDSPATPIPAVEEDTKREWRSVAQTIPPEQIAAAAVLEEVRSTPPPPCSECGEVYGHKLACSTQALPEARQAVLPCQECGNGDPHMHVGPYNPIPPPPVLPTRVNDRQTDPAPPLSKPGNPLWAHALVGKMVMHMPTVSIGRVTRAWPPGTYRSRVTAEVIMGDTVLEMEPGHGFVARNVEDFRVLEEREAKYYDALSQALSHFTREAVVLAAAHNIPPASAAVFIGSALRTQANLLLVAAAS
jgi:hypothetical protein